MPQTSEATYQKLCSAAREATMVGRIQELLEWDERTQMPPAGGEYRADQAAYLAGLAHQKKTDPRLGEWLAELADSPLATDPHSDAGCNIRQLKREYEKQTRLPQTLVEALTRAAVRGQQIWVQARRDDCFADFQPQLKEMVDLKRQEAAALGFEDSPYDALLDEYEPGESTANVRKVLGELRDALVPLVEAIGQSDARPNVAILARDYPIVDQEQFGKQAAAAVGFDFSAGRLDVTDHPFCTGLGPGDVRITTRYDEHAFADAFYSILHEAGHGMYDQGLPREHYGLPTGEFISLGIHESQSRMWENQVGRCRAFWEHFFPQAAKAFPQALGDVSSDAFYAAVNNVRPSLVRVEADEVTYNLHILIRFELELALVTDDLQVADLPGAWNEKYERYLGIRPPSDADGVLQDVHWSAGLFGYFPTYSLGNLYAAQFFAQANADLDGLDEHFRCGDFAPLLAWLRTKIHQHGQRYTASELVERVTGRPLSHSPLMEHLRAKYGEIYGL